MTRRQKRQLRRQENINRRWKRWIRSRMQRFVDVDRMVNCWPRGVGLLIRRSDAFWLRMKDGLDREYVRRLALPPAPVTITSASFYGDLP